MCVYIRLHKALLRIKSDKPSTDTAIITKYYSSLTDNTPAESMFQALLVE